MVCWCVGVLVSCGMLGKGLKLKGGCPCPCSGLVIDLGLVVGLRTCPI